jgi:hypothetical protein
MSPTHAADSGPPTKWQLTASVEEFVQIDKRIDAAEDQAADSVRESLRERWEFGKLMLAERKGKQLPKGVLDQLVEATGRSRPELQFRMQFAERYPTEDEVSNALDTCTSWRQVIRSLPKPKPQSETKAKPTAPPARSKKTDDIIELAETTPIDWNTIPGNQRDKLERAKAFIRKQFEKEYRTRLLAEADQYRAECDANVAAYKAQLDARATAERARRDEEREIYKLGINVARAKGLITPDDYNVIRSCLHPDSRASASEAKLAKAFRLFNDPKVKILLVKEI